MIELEGINIEMQDDETRLFFIFYFFIFFIKFIYTGQALVHSSFLGLSSSQLHNYHWVSHIKIWYNTHAKTWVFLGLWDAALVPQNIIDASYSFVGGQSHEISLY